MPSGQMDTPMNPFISRIEHVHVRFGISMTSFSILNTYPARIFSSHNPILSPANWRQPSLAHDKTSPPPPKAQPETTSSTLQSRRVVAFSTYLYQRLAQRLPSPTPSSRPPFNDCKRCLPLPQRWKREVSWVGSSLRWVWGRREDPSSSSSRGASSSFTSKSPSSQLNFNLHMLPPYHESHHLGGKHGLRHVRGACQHNIASHPSSLLQQQAVTRTQPWQFYSHHITRRPIPSLQFCITTSLPQLSYQGAIYCRQRA
ncbi:hypothetical protein BJ878DRAFT_8944 [Calycina marina]|uniref:Uncharacterized protein n=1 Tax=Calycina marina TaxID=1763456 RepID=A0A9P7Z584_9HELO|nr:hypothetical protein BJ878DRAFT_8944 [Calycina marina]